MVSFGVFRRAVRDRGYRTVIGGPRGPVPVTPIATFRKAICNFHQLGADAARAGVSLTSDYWRTNARGKTLARNYADSLDRYFALDAADGRASYDAGVRQAVNIAGETLNVYIDALVYHGAQHTARVVLWDVPIPSEEEAATMAAPIIEALEAAVGEDRTHSVEFWHLRSGKVFVMGKAMAQARAADAADAVKRAAGL
jgi:hypothetical protein